ncbi:MAG TPA: hypothetical protein DDY20_11065 [Desulfobulbaceae bacterium]|nr:hypothetical protein [Desulfobulbaceae bacterium]
MIRLSSTSVVVWLLLAILAACTCFIPAAGHARSTMEILDMDLQVSPNPIPCGGSATATVTIQTYPGGSLPEGVTTKITLWDYDTGLNGGDDALDHEPVVLTTSMGKVTATLTLHCEIKDAGCDLYGPAGNSGESGTDVFVTVLGSPVKSPRVYVQCKQMEVDAALDLDGTDSISAGGDATVTLSAVQPIPGLDHATWKIEYDPSNLSVARVSYLNPQLAPYLTHTVHADHILFTLRHLPVPLNVSGPMVGVVFTGKSSPAVRWDTTDIRVSNDSVFYNSLGGVLAVCDGGAHAIFIAPQDSTVPVVDPVKILFSRNRIVGSPGAVSDDMGPLPNYLTVALLDEDHKLVSQEFAATDGSFTLDKFFELAMGKASTLKVYNGVGLATSFSFMPTVTPSGALAILLLGNRPPMANIITIIHLYPDPSFPLQVQLHANAMDPDNDPVSLRINWGDGKFTEYGPLQPSGFLFLEEHEYLAPGTYQLKARARDSKGREGAWTAAQEVVIPF